MPGLCGVCKRSAAKYTCPRCQIPYCTLDCYKGHSDRCTESFYQAQVEEELHSHRATGEERRRLERILAELNQLGDAGPGDEEEEEELEEQRLLALAERAERGDLQLEDLTAEEVAQFHSELRRGALGQALGVWEPWWQRAAVFEFDLNAMDEDVPSSPSLPRAPAALVPPVHVCCAAGREAHPSVALTCLEVLYAYAHTMRAFNGDWAWDPVQAALHLLHLGSTICSRKLYSAACECLNAVLVAAAALPGGGFGVGLDLLCLADLSILLSRGAGTAALAMRETERLMEDAAREVEERNADGAKVLTKLRRGAKKLEFLVSFAAHHEDALQPLAEQVQALERTRRQEVCNQEDEENRRAHGGVALPCR